MGAGAATSINKPSFKVHAMSVSSNSLSAVLFAQDIGVGKFEMCDLMKGGNKTPEYLAMNPFHQIPTLQGDNGVTIGESNAILRHLAGYATSYYPPADAKLRARIDWAMDAMSTTVYSKWSVVIYPALGFRPAAADLAKANTELKESIDCFAQAFIGSGDFICGATLTIADYKALPFFYVMTLPVMQKLTGVKLSARLERYVETVMKSSASSAMLASFGGWSLNEYIETKKDSKAYAGSTLVCGEASDCKPPRTGVRGWLDCGSVPRPKATIYGMEISTNALGPVIFGQEIGIASFEKLDLMKGEHKTPAFLAKNPFHQIPLYEEEGGFCIGESNAMLRHMASSYAPEYYVIHQRAKIDWALDALATSIYKSATCGVYYPVFGFSAALDDQKKANDELTDFLDKYDKAFLKEGKFVGGDQITIADFKALPVMYALNLDLVKAKTGFQLSQRMVTYLKDMTAKVKSATLLEKSSCEGAPSFSFCIKDYAAMLAKK